MIGLVENVLVQVEPIAPGEFALRATKPDSQGNGRLYLYCDNQIVEAGRTFYCMEKDGTAIINGRTGEFNLGPKSRARFRCVFGGQHIEFTTNRK